MRNNFIKEYGRVVGCFMFFILLLIIPNISSAASQCSKDGYTIVTINGVNITDTQARQNMIALYKEVGFSWKNQNINYQYLLNPTHTFGVDIFDAGIQKMNEETDSDLEDSDFAHMLTDASNKVTTQKVLFVGHSQGNFYANTFYDDLIDAPGGIPSESMGVYAVATPADRVAGNGLYTTSNTDKVIGVLSNILAPNVHIDYKLSDDDGLGHDFTKIYLAYEGDKIVSDIQTSLNKLKTNDVQSADDPCIDPPKLTMAQKVQGAILATTDVVSLPIQDASVAIFEGTVNAGLAIANGIQSASVAVKNTVSNLLASAVDSLPNTNTLVAGVSPLVASTTTSSADKTISPLNNKAFAGKEVAQNFPIENFVPLVTNATSFFPNVTSSILGGGSHGGNRLVAFDEDDPGSSVIPPPVDSSDPTSPTTPASTPDTNAPIITVLGDNPVIVAVDSSYTDAGATALDDVDGVVGVVTTGTVDSTTIGTYTITYTAEDLSGNISTATRTVNVIAATPTPTSPDPTPISAPTSNTTTIDTDTTLTAGEYTYDNLLITNNAVLTLVGDPTSTNAFKGVKINAVNITIDPGSSISADGQGYQPNSGPGVSSDNSIGASYGGVSYSGANYSNTYGSAMKPIDLGSGGATSGGGAIELVVSDTFTNNGIVSANGYPSGSGGSVYITADTITGSGLVSADGGSLYQKGYFQSAGGGGRVAVYYQASSFSGSIESKGCCGSYNSFTTVCAENGTVGLFDESKNDLYVNGSNGSEWQFLQADEPFSFNNIYISNGAQVSAEKGVQVTAQNLFIDKNSSFNLADNEELNIPIIKIDGASTLTLSGTETINTTTLTVTGNSTVTVLPQKILSLNIPNIDIDAGSSISADAKGYGPGAGPGSPTTIVDPANPSPYYAGGSYGGIGFLNSPTSTYGSLTMPTDFGSAGNGSNAYGGGAIKITANGTLVNNGTISANGGVTSSGGSIYVTANTLSGAGSLQANGGGVYCPFTCYAPGAGGRVAVYYDSSSFVGSTITLGGVNTGAGIKSGDGTVYILDQSIPVSTPTVPAPLPTPDPTPNPTPTPDPTPDPTPIVPTPTPTPFSVLPSITSYTFNSTAANITTNPLTHTLTLVLTASENVNWESVKIENQADSSIYKIFQSGTGCVDGTSTCTKTWNGLLSKGGLLQNGTFRIKAHIKDATGNEFEDYLTPYTITVDTSL